MGEAKRRREMVQGWHQVEFQDAGHEAEVAPNPAYPDGVAIDMTQEAPGQSCLVMLPYPAPRIGAMVVSCRRCGLRVGASVAGRVDDPRSIRMPCRAQPGKTGQYPGGVSARPGDEGGANVLVSTPDAAGNIYIDFGTPVSWWTLKRAQAIEFALELLQKAGVKVERQGMAGHA